MYSWSQPFNLIRGFGPEHFISVESLYPLSFDNAAPASGASDYLQDPSIRLLADFFQGKGLDQIKREDREEGWYPDWIDYQARHGLYAGVLSPKAYSTRGHHFDLLKLTRFVEAFAYFSPAHGYSLQVSFLGLFPILISDNEQLKREAIARLEGGGLFAFAVSERAHGSDLLANEFAVTLGPDGRTANGSKCYIGNANAASMISVLARQRDADAPVGKRAPFVFFALRPDDSAGYENVRKIRTFGVRNAFVGEFDVRNHPVPDGDIISQHREAWAAFFGTLDFGKFFLGFGAVGICEHAFAEASAYLWGRILYGEPAAALPHIRRAMAIAFARLIGMKFYAYRALDYLQAAGPADRRYLLFNPVQKARVSSEGVKVMAVLSECMGARGFEADTYFETALRDVPMIPSLEGSTHINYEMTSQFLETYFADPSSAVCLPKSVSLGQVTSDENPYWMGTRDRNAHTLRFGNYLKAYETIRTVPNVELFVHQATEFARLANEGASKLNATSDPGIRIGLGRCLSVIAYGQLVAEMCIEAGAAHSTVSLLFHAQVEDLSTECLKLAVFFPPGSPRRTLLREIVRVPETTEEDFTALTALITTRYVA